MATLKPETFNGETVHFDKDSDGISTYAYVLYSGANKINPYDGKPKVYTAGKNKKDAFENIKPLIMERKIKESTISIQTMFDKLSTIEHRVKFRNFDIFQKGHLLSHIYGINSNETLMSLSTHQLKLRTYPRDRTFSEVVKKISTFNGSNTSSRISPQEKIALITDLFSEIHLTKEDAINELKYANEMMYYGKN